MAASPAKRAGTDTEQIGMRRGSRRIPRGWLTLVLVVVAGCSVFDPDDYEDERERLSERREQWRSQGIDSYEFVLQRLCFCGGGTTPANVVVRNGQRISVTNVETGEPVPELFEDAYLTVAELFAFIEDAIEREAYSIDVEYDAQYGYPTSIRIDYIENAVDEEMAFEASAMRPQR
jgi:hypothetical protein